MFKQLHITITGDLGSGKSTVAKEIAGVLHFSYFSTGGLQRSLAEKQNLDTLGLNLLSEKDKSIDNFIDGELKKLNYVFNSFVIDARLGFYFIKPSFKVYLTVDLETAADRILQDQLRVSENQTDPLELKMLEIQERKQSEIKRFKQMYQIDCANLSHFDLVIDTTYKTTTEVCTEIINDYKKFVMTYL